MMESHSRILAWADHHSLKNQNLRGITNVSPPDELQREDHRFFPDCAGTRCLIGAEPKTFVAPVTTGWFLTRPMTMLSKSGIRAEFQLQTGPG
ncbi:MAG: hypothetical protein WBN92_06740, partial [Terriglobia bacterium]